MAAWALKDAEASAKEVFARAFKGEPQIVTRRGIPSLVIITYADFAARNTDAQPEVKSSTRRKRKSFVDFLRSCPVDLSELDLERDKDVGVNRETVLTEGVLA